MKKVLTCRRSTVALVAIVALTILGLVKDLDVAMAIAGIAGSLAASNAYEKRGLDDVE